MCNCVEIEYVKENQASTNPPPLSTTPVTNPPANQPGQATLAVLLNRPPTPNAKKLNPQTQMLLQN